MTHPDSRRGGSLPFPWAAVLAAGLITLACGAGSSGAIGDAGSGGQSGSDGGLSSGGSGGGGSGGALGSGGAGATGSGATAGAGGARPDDLDYDVVVNPYGTNPLSAVVNLRGLPASDVRSLGVVVAGQDGGADFAKTYLSTDAELVANLDSSDLPFPVGGYHVPVYGLYADRVNTVRIHVDRIGHDPLDMMVPIETPLSRPGEDAWVPRITIDTALPARMEPGWTVAELNIETLPSPPIVFVEWTRYIAFDEQGAIRWALRFDDLPKGETFTLRRSIDGNFLTGSLDTLIQVTKLGRITRTARLADHTLNHELLQIGSQDNGEGVLDGTASPYVGNVLVLASKNGATTVQDRILELDLDGGAVLHEWDLAQVFDPTRTTFVDPEQWAPGAGDWLHDNGLAYSAADESLVVSGRHQGVAKVRRDGSLIWLLAPHKGWNPPQLQKLLTAVDAAGMPYGDAVQAGDAAAGDPAAPDFDWPFGQHSPTLLRNGDLLLFDNGYSRHFGPPYASYSRAVVYRIDETAMTIRQMGQFILTKRESSYFVSDTCQLPATGNLFIQPGGSATNPAVVKELTAQVADDGTISFDTLVFDAALDMSWADPTRWYVYSYRGHRWTF